MRPLGRERQAGLTRGTSTSRGSSALRVAPKRTTGWGTCTVLVTRMVAPGLWACRSGTSLSRRSSRRSAPEPSKAPPASGDVKPGGNARRRRPRQHGRQSSEASAARPTSSVDGSRPCRAELAPTQGAADEQPRACRATALRSKTKSVGGGGGGGGGGGEWRGDHGAGSRPTKWNGINGGNSPGMIWPGWAPGRKGTEMEHSQNDQERSNWPRPEGMPGRTRSNGMEWNEMDGRK